MNHQKGNSLAIKTEGRMITVSPRAVEKLREELLQRFKETGFGFRIARIADESGETSFSVRYDNRCADDEIMEFENIAILLDPATAAQLKECELGYMDEPGGGFVLKSRDSRDDSAEKKGG